VSKINKIIECLHKDDGIRFYCYSGLAGDEKLLLVGERGNCRESTLFNRNSVFIAFWLKRAAKKIRESINQQQVLEKIW